MEYKNNSAFHEPFVLYKLIVDGKPEGDALEDHEEVKTQIDGIKSFLQACREGGVNQKEIPKASVAKIIARHNSITKTISPIEI